MLEWNGRYCVILGLSVRFGDFTYAKVFVLHFYPSSVYCEKLEMQHPSSNEHRWYPDCGV